MYSVVEIFQSLQGEGRFVGYPVNFIRLAGCSLGCKFCDTDIKEREKLAPAEMLPRLDKDYSRVVVLTGGEPLEQNCEPLVKALNNYGFMVHLETNGTQQFPPIFHWVSLSPKKNKGIHTSSFALASEIKWLVPHWPLSTILDVVGRYPIAIHYVQPVNFRWKVNTGALTKCLDYIHKSGGRLNLSIQLHKVIGVR